MTTRPEKHLAFYSYFHPLLGDVEADVQYWIDDPNGVPFLRITGIKVDGRWLSEPMSLNSGWDFVGRPGTVLEQALFALIVDHAYANVDWNITILRDHGYRYVGEGGNDPHGHMVRYAEAAS